jgi:gliding motility-associated lipoprotein GldH
VSTNPKFVPLILFLQKIIPLTKYSFLVAFVVLVDSCTLPTGVFEKNVPIPNHRWESSFTPEISFTIEDTASVYDIFLVLRHTDAYHYNNIWIKATVLEPGSTQSKSGQYNLILATNQKGWLGSAMDDIYENRVLIQPDTKFKKPGSYRMIIEQIMREDPLQQVLNVGIRVQRANR